MNDVQGLIEKAEAATGPDRLTDAMLHLMIEPELGTEPWFQPDVGWWVYRGDGQKDDRHAPAYTASIDAALALMERVHDGGEPVAKYPLEMTLSSVGKPSENGPWRCAIWTGNDDTDGVYRFARSAPLAIILATLRATGRGK